MLQSFGGDRGLRHLAGNLVGIAAAASNGMGSFETFYVRQRERSRRGSEAETFAMSWRPSLRATVWPVTRHPAGS